ncbi:MAG: ATP-binding protein [bacterium]
MRLGLTTRIVFSFLVVVAVSISVPSLYGFSYLSRLIYQEAQLKMESDIEIANLLLKQKKQSLLMPARVLSKDISFNRILAGRVGDLVKVRVKYFVRGLSESDLTYMTVVDRDGIVLFRSQAAYSTGDNMSGDPAVRRALKGEEVITFKRLGPYELWQEGQLAEPPDESSHAEGLAIVAVVPVYMQTGPEDIGGFQAAPGENEVVGAIIVGYLLNRDKTLLAEIHGRTRGIASIYTAGGLVNSSDASWNGELRKGLFREVAGSKTRSSIVRYGRSGEIAGYVALRGYDNRPAALFELRSSTVWINKAKYASLRDNFFFTLIGIAMAFGLGLVLARRITDPVQRLRKGAEEIGRGNLMHRIDIPGDDEISQLADAFNDMSVRLFRSMEEMRMSKRQIEDYSQRLKSAHSSLEMYSRELEKVNQELLKSNINLRKANEVKDTFLSTVSHELKTPLTTIIGYISMLLEGALGPLADEQRQSLDVVLRRGRNLQALISDLLNLSRIDAGRMELRRSYVDLGKELRSLEEVFSERLKEAGLSLEIFVEDNLPHVYADRDRINQALFNLTGNAIKFTPSGGLITVQGRHRKEENLIEISVTDTGIGVPESEQGHIFERFYQVDKHDGREFAGTGLGLAITKELIELHGGRISIESRPGRGSAFTFTLPLK